MFFYLREMIFSVIKFLSSVAPQLRPSSSPDLTMPLGRPLCRTGQANRG